MSNKIRLLLVSLLLLGCGAAVFLGHVEQNVSLSSVLELWGDTLRDADEAGLQLTRVSDADEMQLGNQLAATATWWARKPEWEPYVSAVGASVAANVQRKGIRYQFFVADLSDVNAFALPGGHIYVTTGLLGFLHSEAELAAVLGHEISHVDLRHCVERYQYQLKLRKLHVAPVGQLADIARSLAAIGYSKYQELDADANGARLSSDAGYDPTAAYTVFLRLAGHIGEPRAVQARTPSGEVIGAAAGAVSDYFRSHPLSRDRSERLEELTRRNRSRLHSRSVYVGTENYRRRIPMSQQRFSGEDRTLDMKKQ